jgi:glycosyltransferase involved in cell wall biosynthesis
MPAFTLAYCTNFWSHHQAPVCTELARLLGEDRFKLCLFEPVDAERRQLGWAGDVPDYKWIAGPPSSTRDMERLIQIVCDADVAVIGHCPHEVRAARAATGKLTFINSERLMRDGFFHDPILRKWLFQLRMINPRFAKQIRRLRSVANRANVHYLAIGAHAVEDAKLIGSFDDRIWNWAYFISQPEASFRERSSPHVRILWAGRFIAWKRVDVILRAIAMLGHVAGNFKLELIGNGPTRNANERLAKRLGLAGRVCFRDAMSHEAVRERMAEADLYIFPSNHLEGWGAVVGEAMCAGCVVVASKAAGASNILIEHGRTGFLFADGDIRELADILRQVIEDSILRRQIGRAAMAYMQELWHPRVGAGRLVGLCRGLLGLAPMPAYPYGPCCNVCLIDDFIGLQRQSD